MDAMFFVIHIALGLLLRPATGQILTTSSSIQQEPQRTCVCGTLNHNEGSADDKKAELENIHEKCVPHDENLQFHNEVLHCNASNIDTKNNTEVCQLGSCVTDGYCFKWLVKDGSKITATYGCLPSHLLRPAKRPFICYPSKSKAHEFLSACCWEQDGCNVNISLAFTPKPNGFLFQNGDSQYPNVPLLVVFILLPVAILSLIIGLGFFIWHRYNCFGIVQKPGFSPMTSSNSHYVFGSSGPRGPPSSNSRGTDITLPLIDGDIR